MCNNEHDELCAKIERDYPAVGEFVRCWAPEVNRPVFRSQLVGLLLSASAGKARVDVAGAPYERIAELEHALRDALSVLRNPGRNPVFEHRLAAWQVVLDGRIK